MMFANTMVEIMITTNATMITRHPKSLRRATMSRSTMFSVRDAAKDTGPHHPGVSVPRRS